jgi:Ca2+-binding RTX toxin-like protein
MGTWDNEAFGRDVSSAEFLASPELQEKLFKTKFGQFAAKHGPAGAASMWHSGRPTPGNTRDSLGTSTKDYVAKFMKAAGGRPAFAGGEGAARLRGGSGGDQILTSGQGDEVYQPDQLQGGSGDEQLDGGSGQDTGISIPKPDLSIYRRQAQIGQAMMRNPRTRAQGYEIYTRAMQGAQQEARKYKELEIEYGLRDAQERRKIAREEAKERDKLHTVGGRGFVRQPDGTYKEVIGAKEGEGNEIVLPDGTTVRTGGGKKTELNAKYGQFHTRGTVANANLAKVEDALTVGKDRYVADSSLAPQMFKDMWLDPKFKIAKQAADDFLVTIIRPDTGAAVTDTEFDIYGRIFLPSPNDPPALVAQKRKSRETALNALKEGLTPEQILQRVDPGNFDGTSTVPKSIAEQAQNANSKYKPGYKEGGYTFKGGDPTDQNNWVKD